jgi:predicted Zn-dependent protease with MMP-like domain
MTDWTSLKAPSLDDFAELARQALAELPEPFKGLAADVAMRVADFPEEALLEALGIEDPFDLTGVYHGADLARRSVLDPVVLPSEILLFRRPILDEWAEHGDIALGELIAHVLVHELGHHFGLSDADIHAAEDR